MDPDEESMVETVFLGGEQASTPLINAWTTRNRRLYNGYGPTETTCGSLMAELKPNCPVLLGRSIHYGKVILVDEEGHEAEEGELYITGLGVAVGYYRNEELTAKSFVQWNGERAYRTGDFGRQTPDGIMFLGRRDSFVKNRGFLINLEGDVEPAMCSFPGVKTAVALHYKGRLYGIVSPEAASEGLREYLAERHSAFIIPDIVLSQDTFPSTANGKIDRKALLGVIVARECQAELVKAGDILSPEDAVQKVFSQTLGIPLLEIDLSSSFRGLGGHSLAAIIAAGTLRKLSFCITVPQILQFDTVGAIAVGMRSLDQVHPRDSKHFDRKSEDLQKAIVDDGYSEADIEEVAPMTDMQARLVRTSIESPSQNFVRISLTFQHKTPETLEILRESWATILRRHSIFRTSYLLSIGNGVQLVHKNCNLSWEETVATEETWESVCLAIEGSDSDQLVAFDEKSLSSLSKFQIITIPGDRSRLFWKVHHSLIDGWSASRILSELQSITNKEVEQSLPPQFSEVALCIEQAELESREVAKKFWSRTMQDFESNSLFHTTQPSDHPLRSSTSERNMATRLKMADLSEFARSLHVTTASVIYSAWAMVLARYAGTEKVVFGAVIAGRNIPIPSIEKVVGPLMNSLPFMVKVNDSNSIEELLQDVFTSLCELFEYQWSSNSLIQEATGTKGTDFYETMISLQYDFPKVSSEWAVLGNPKDISYSEVTEVPLTVIVDQEDGDLALRFMYKRSHFGDDQVGRLMSHFVNILEKLIHSQSSRLVDEVMSEMMSCSETNSRINNSECLDLEYSGPRTLKDAFESASQQWGDLVAIRSVTRQLTYKELDALSNQVAHNLTSHVQSGDTVCIISDGSVEWVIAIIAVIKCGAAYCPIDINLPTERMTVMVGLSKCTIALYPSNSSIENAGVFSGVMALSLEALLESPLQLCAPLNQDPSPSHVACLVFTSGSTGTPKGKICRGQFWIF
jgi:non-ribosomal peptide synthetase component F